MFYSPPPLFSSCQKGGKAKQTPFTRALSAHQTSHLPDRTLPPAIYHGIMTISILIDPFPFAMFFESATSIDRQG
jgi:hypothetical protein